MEFEATNQIEDYTMLGFDRNMVKNSDELYRGTRRTKDYSTSLEFDSQVESLDIGKLSTNSFKQVMKMGNLTIDGKNGRITVSDGRNTRVIIGKL